MRSKKIQKFSVINKKRSQNGKLAIILAVISAAAFAFCILNSIINDGKGGTYLGAIGFAAMMLSLFGSAVCIKDLVEKKERTTFTYLGAILAGVMFLAWIAVILSGIKK